jgi:cytochrome c oxidase cbb3-type subunit IV
LLADLVNDVLRPLWGVWVMVLFLGIVFVAYRPKNKDKWNDCANIPLRDDDDKER